MVHWVITEYRLTFVVVGMIKLSQKVLNSSERQVATYDNESGANDFLHRKTPPIRPEYTPTLPWSHVTVP